MTTFDQAEAALGAILPQIIHRRFEADSEKATWEQAEQGGVALSYALHAISAGGPASKVLPGFTWLQVTGILLDMLSMWALKRGAA